ncbi:MAG: hypothetical protein U0235_23400 [Polyangiaceae bacterium]
MKGAWGAGLVIVAVALAACSDGGAGTIGGGTASTSDAFADQFCALYKPCCSQAGLRTDGAVCKAFVGVAAAQGSYDPAAGNKCLGELRAASGSADFCGASSSKVAPTCQTVYGSKGSSSSGTKAPGDACSSSSDCASSPEGEVTCRYSTSDKQFCQVQIDGKEGDSPCIGTKDGIVTSYTTSSSGGAPPPPRGYVCDRAKDLACDGAGSKCAALGTEAHRAARPPDRPTPVSRRSTATSAPRSAPGRGAEGDDSKSSVVCGKLARCDTATKKCVALDPDGTPCTSSSTCQARICTNQRRAGMARRPALRSRCSSSAGSDWTGVVQAWA